MTVRFAILGVGRIGRVHADAISGNGGAALLAVADSQAEAAEAARAERDAELQRVRSEHKTVMDDSSNRIADLQQRTGHQDGEIKRLEEELAKLRTKADAAPSPTPAPAPQSPPPAPQASPAAAVSQSPSPAPSAALAPSPSPSSAPAAAPAPSPAPAPTAAPVSAPQPAPASGSAPDAGPPSNAGGAASPASDPAPSQPAPAAASDDLTKIKGIGPVLKEKLNKLGINSFQQIAEFTPEDIARVDAVLDFPGRIDREKWGEQAQEIVRR